MAPLESPYLVTNTARKLHLLNALVENRSLLTIILADIKEPVTSAILEVERDKIILDELIPHSINLAFNPETRFSVITKLRGIPLKFQSNVSSVGLGRDGITFYACSLPDRVNYHQKRRDYRLSSRGAIWPSILVSEIKTETASPVADENVDVDVDVDGEKPDLLITSPDMGAEDIVESLSGKITDISLGGASAEFDTLPAWANSTQPVSCAIELTDGPMVFTRSRICHIQKLIRGKRNKMVFNVGLEFLSLNPLSKKQLQQWIFNSERKQLRR